MRSYLTRIACAFILAGIWSSAPAESLDQWTWRNPLPDGNPQPQPHSLYGVFYTNGLFVAVGEAGVVSLSSDATNWTEKATGTTQKLNGIVYGAGQYVAVGVGGVVQTSTDGTNWLVRTSGTSNSLSAITYGNGSYVAVGDHVILASSNAVNWSAMTPSTNLNFSGIAYGNSGFVVIAAAGTFSSTEQVLFSSNGVTWTNYQLGNSVPAPFGGTFHMDHRIVTFQSGTYVIGSVRGFSSASVDRFIFTSANGLNWTTNFLGNLFTSTSYVDYFCFASGNGTLLASGHYSVGNFADATSDLANWTMRGNLTPDYYGQLTAGAYGNGNFVFVGLPSFGSLPPIFTSTDGTNWVNQQHPPPPPVGPTGTFTSIVSTNGLYVATTSTGIVRSTNGLVYVAVSNSPTLTAIVTYFNTFVGVGPGGAIYQSNDGISWTPRNSATIQNLRGVAASSAMLVAVGDNGAIQTSVTGSIWTTRTSGTSLRLSAVVFANGQFVAVGQMGTVLTSPDGISWTGQDSGQLNDLLSITYGWFGFVAVGNGGAIVTSPDGVNWTQRNSQTGSALQGVAFGNGYYVAVGANSVVRTSINGITWTPRNVPLSGGQVLYGAAFINGRFVVVGAGGTVLDSAVVAALLFTLHISHDSGNTWVVVTGPADSNFRIQTSTNLATGNWIDAASFTNAAATTMWTNPFTGISRSFYRTVSP